MRPTSPVRLLAPLVAIAALCASVPNEARAQSFGFTLNRYEPSAAGSWTFAVETPWYSKTRWFAGGLTLNYAHRPLVLGTYGADGAWQETNPVVTHSVMTHVDLAGSFLDRVQVNVSLPVTWAERGSDSGVGGISPIAGVGVGDLRVGAIVRAWKQADKDPISIHVGAYLWIPFMQHEKHQGDRNVRFMPKLIVAGLIRDHLRYSANLGFLIRPEAQLTPTIATGTSGSEFQVGLSAGYTNKKQTFYVGPEILFSSQMVPSRAFTLDTSGLELLVGGQYLVKDLVMVGAAIGPGFMTGAGSPDMRLLARVAYAPVKDTDGDGIVDRDDACPKVKGIRTEDPTTNGCPEPDRDRDGDGVVDPKDVCPDEHMGDHPDPKRVGCPLIDTDQDEIFDIDDVCPTVHKGKVPDPARLGCPLDTDKDTVLDVDDVCVEIPQGTVPDPKRPGCPLDTDLDTVIDEKDQCVDVPMGLNPDPNRLGCPIGDRDKDNIPDNTDACPDKPGAPDPDPAKNGCPGLVQIKNGMIVILEPVYFATDKDVILPKSFPVMNAVANALKAQPQIKKIRVEGHTDSRGSMKHNVDLSDRRAKSCMRYLAQHGIEAGRVEAQGFGPTRPIATNKTDAGRAQNRRVEFHIIDPAPPAGAERPVAPPPEAAPAAAVKGKAKGKGKVKGKLKAKGKGKKRPAGAAPF